MSRTLAAAFVMTAGIAHAEEASVSATDTLIGEVHTDNKNRLGDDDDYGVVINRLNVNGHADGLTADVRVDSVTFAQRPNLEYKSDVRIERLSARYTVGDLKIRAGDFFKQLGRGIALSIRKQDEIGLDVAIRGGELVYSSDLHAVSLFGGVANPANLDAVSQKWVRDPEDVFAGGSYELRAFDAATVGAYGLYFTPRQNVSWQPFQPEAYLDSTGSGGTYIEVPPLADLVSIYAEADVQYRRIEGIGSIGYGGYGTADVAFGDTQILLEGIFLHDYELRGSQNTALGNRFVYNRVPTLQRVEEEVLNGPFVTGTRLKVEHYFGGIELLIYGNGLFNLVRPSRIVETPVRQLHGWGGLEWALGESLLNLSGGYRNESQAGALVRRMPHAEGDFLLPIGDRFAVHLTSNIEIRTVNKVGVLDTYVRGSTFAALERAGLGGVTFELGYDTEDSRPTIRNLFYAGIVSWHVIDELDLTATVGTQRGGIKCVGGVCRDYPAFAGGRIEVVGRL